MTTSVWAIGAGADYAALSLAAAIVNPATDAVVIYDTILSSRLTQGLTYSITTGRWVIKANRFGLFWCQVKMSHTAGYVCSIRVYDVTNAAQVGPTGFVYPVTGAVNQSPAPSLLVPFSPTVDTTYELRLIATLTAGADVDALGTIATIVMF
jgi:hypothetical protein